MLQGISGASLPFVRPKLSRIISRQSQQENIMVRIIHSRILGGWFVVRGRHQTPISGRFESRAAALEHLNRNR